MSKIKAFFEERNEVFASGDEHKIRKYCEKYNIEIPEDETIFSAGIHKVICNLFLTENSPITIERFHESINWLEDHGYSPVITFDLPEENFDEVEED